MATEDSGEGVFVGESEVRDPPLDFGCLEVTVQAASRFDLGDGSAEGGG